MFSCGSVGCSPVSSVGGVSMGDSSMAQSSNGVIVESESLMVTIESVCEVRGEGPSLGTVSLVCTVGVAWTASEDAMSLSRLGLCGWSIQKTS